MPILYAPKYENKNWSMFSKRKERFDNQKKLREKNKSKNEYKNKKPKKNSLIMNYQKP